MAIAFHTIKRQPYGSCQLPITVTKHDHLIQQFIYHHVLAISHHSKPCKNKLDVLYFVVASFTWLLRASSKNRSYLRIKTTMVIYQVCCFNSIQLKLEKQTPANLLYAKLVACPSVEPVSWTWSCNVGPGRFIQQYRRIKIRHWW